MTDVKPRWKEWENTCIKQAVEHKIQLKVTAFALDKTVNSVSKKIKTLGLRKPTTKSGRLKGDKSDISLLERIPLDREKMVEILQLYAPLHVFQKAQLSLKEGCWTSSPSLSVGLKRGESCGSISQENASFSNASPLDYSLLKGHLPQKLEREKTFGNPLYVPLCYMEEWAVSEGFYQVERGLLQRGLCYWKEGIYFSKAQLLMYVNRIRFDKNLQPLALYEEEEL